MKQSTIEFVAANNYNRMDVCVAEACSITRAHAQKLIADGYVTYNGSVCKKSSHSVKTDDCLHIVLPQIEPISAVAQDIPIDIVYQDECLAVINKQQGLTVHPCDNQIDGTLVNALLFHIKDLSGINGALRPGIVHRLDKDTSGLIVIAKNDDAHQSLAAQIQSKECHREYIAIVEGVVKQDCGVIDKSIGRSRIDRKKMAIDSTGRSAVTDFEVIKRFKKNTLVKFVLKTGRTHQIRVHTQSIGHPIVGDRVYGYKNQRFNLSGQLLHAYKLSFRHPKSGKNMEFIAPIPTYFDAILNILEKES
ncbi:MAG: RluA family pseudouridine synthase [Corallococcus sp.]|nr:RluA family pseudouridine synthase [Corallococcus sp.]